MSLLLASLLIVGLALLDSTTVGTFVIPLWLLMSTNNYRTTQILTYLVTVSASYFALGALGLTLARTVVDQYSDFLRSQAGATGQIILGAALVLWGLGLSLRRRFSASRARKSAGSRRSGGKVAHVSAEDANQITATTPNAASIVPTTLMARLQHRVLASHHNLTGLALMAVALEVATMWPYLTGIGILAQPQFGLTTGLVLLGVYCTVMISPALLLVGARWRFPAQTQQLLEEFSRLLQRTSQHVASPWLMAGFGVLLIILAVT